MKTLTGMEIVPWKPTGAALALQVFAASFDQHNPNQEQQASSGIPATYSRPQAWTTQADIIKHVYKRCAEPKRNSMSLPSASSMIGLIP